MAAQFQFIVHDGNNTVADICRIFKIQQEDAEDNSTNWFNSGSWNMADGLDFPTQQFNSINKARDWLEDNCRTFGPALAVRTLDADNDDQPVWVMAAWCHN